MIRRWIYTSIRLTPYNGSVNRDIRMNKYYTGARYDKASRQFVKLKTPKKFDKDVDPLPKEERPTRTLDSYCVGDNGFENLISLGPND